MDALKNRGGVTKGVIEEWLTVFPDAPVLASTPDMCFSGGKWSDSDVAKSFTFVHQSGADECVPADSMKDAPAEWRDRDSASVDVTVNTYVVQGTMAKLNPQRTYALAVPKANACSETSPCPLMVSLHGLGEHGAPGDDDSVKLLGKTGFLRMATQDEGCSATLRSILLVPQILPEESWVKDGPFLLKNFVMPLLRQVRESNHVDPRRIGIVGFSEGALGALHAVMSYEHVFSVVVAASASVPSWVNMTLAADGAPEVAATPSTLPGPPMVAITLGEKDASGSQLDNMHAILGLLGRGGLLDRVRLDFRLLAGIGHNHWEKVFNNWHVFFNAAWLGKFRQ